MQDTIAPTSQAPADAPGPVPDTARAGQPATGTGHEERPANGPGEARVPASDRASLIARLLGLLKREPVLFVSLAYVLVSFMGIWSSYWFYRTLGLPILDYLQGSDLFIAGLRRPDYVLLVAAALVVPWVSTVPMRLAERDPARAEQLRRTRWWGPMVFPRQRSWMDFWGVRSETMLAVGFLALLLYYLYLWNTKMAERVVAGTPSGQQVRLTLAGSDAPLPDQASLLGTTSMFVLVWWPATARAEALPTANIARIESVASPVTARPAPASQKPQKAQKAQKAQKPQKPQKPTAPDGAPPPVPAQDRKP